MASFEVIATQLGVDAVGIVDAPTTDRALLEFFLENRDIVRGLVNGPPTTFTVKPSNPGIPTDGD